MDFERKTSPNQFLMILFETQDQKLEKILQTFSSVSPFPSWPLETRHIY